jgi:hypothetical protein
MAGSLSSELSDLPLIFFTHLPLIYPLNGLIIFSPFTDDSFLRILRLTALLKSDNIEIFSLSTSKEEQTQK